MKKYKLLPRDKSVKKKNVENIAYDEIITNVIQGKHLETKEYKEKELRINDVIQNVRVETPNQIKGMDEKEKCQKEKNCENNVVSTGYIKQITISPHYNGISNKPNNSDLTKKFIKLEKENLEYKCKLETNSGVINSKQKWELGKDNRPISRMEKTEKYVKLETNKKIPNGSSSPKLLANHENNSRLITGSKIASYLTVSKRLIFTKNTENSEEHLVNKNNITKLKQAFSPKHREIIHESGNKIQQSQQSNKINKKSYQYIQSLKSEKSINLERKPSLNVLRNNVVTPTTYESKSPYYTNNLTTIKNHSKFLTKSLTIKADNFSESKNEKRDNNEISEKLEKNSSCKNLSSNGNYRIINLKNKVVMKTFSPKPIHRSPAIGIIESFGIEIKERVLNKKPSENNFTLTKLNSFLNKPKTSSSSKLNIFLNDSKSDKSLQTRNSHINCENKNKSDEPVNSRTQNIRTTSSNKNKSLISQYGIPTVSTTLCDTGINPQFMTNENGTLSSSVSFTNSEGSSKGVRSLSEARKSKQMEKAAFGNFNSITKNYQDCINNALNSISKELRKMDNFKSSVSASVGV